MSQIELKPTYRPLNGNFLRLMRHIRCRTRSMTHRNWFSISRDYKQDQIYYHGFIEVWLTLNCSRFHWRLSNLFLTRHKDYLRLSNRFINIEISKDFVCDTPVKDSLGRLFNQFLQNMSNLRVLEAVRIMRKLMNYGMESFVIVISDRWFIEPNRTSLDLWKELDVPTPTL